jgi:hypothetical protein
MQDASPTKLRSWQIVQPALLGTHWMRGSSGWRVTTEADKQQQQTWRRDHRMSDEPPPTHNKLAGGYVNSLALSGVGVIVKYL